MDSHSLGLIEGDILTDLADTAMVRQYCEYLGISFEEFLEGASYSLWEKIDGFNRTVIADNAVKGRYHIMTSWFDGSKKFGNYKQIDNGKKVFEGGRETPEDFEELIELYETIRNLGHFDPNHCSLMEFQTDGQGNHYFLQKHRARDFESCDFTLDRKAQDGEFQALLVRGATPKEGITHKLVIANGDLGMWEDAKGLCLKRDEKASYDQPSISYKEIMARRWDLFVKGIELEVDTIQGWTIYLGNNHISRSLIFKPQVTAIVPRNPLFSEDEYSQAIRYAMDTNQDYCIDVHIVSDGRRAILKRI